MASMQRKRPHELYRAASCKRTMDSDLWPVLTPKREQSPCTPTHLLSGKSSPTFLPKRRMKTKANFLDKLSAWEERPSDMEDTLNRSTGTRQCGGKIRVRRRENPSSQMQIGKTTGTGKKMMERENSRVRKRGEGQKRKEEDDTEETFGLENCRRILEDVIHCDSRGRDLLIVVQQGYEGYIKALTSALDATTSELQTVQEQFSAKVSHCKQLEICVEALQTKNQNLSFTLSLQNFQNSDPALTDREASQLSVLKKQVRFLVRILDNLKDKGFPVEEAFREIRLNTKSTRDSDASEFLSYSDLPSTISDSSGSENMLILEVKEAESHKKERKKLVPNIVIPCERPPDFQEEFFSKFDEFSESWRLQITKTQNKLMGDLLK